MPSENQQVLRLRLAYLMRFSFSAITSLIGFIVIYILAQLIKSNLVYVFGLTNNIYQLGITLSAWLLAFLVVYSGFIIYSYCSNITPINYKEDYILKPFEKRRKLCKPLLIGALVGFVSPLIFSALFSIRQRSWQMTASTIWIVLVANFILIPPSISLDGNPRSITTSYQLVCGIAAYFASRKNKLELR